MSLEKHEFEVLLKIRDDVSSVKEISKYQTEEIIDVRQRVSALERKWWTIHGAWLTISGVAFFFKDRLSGLFP